MSEREARVTQPTTDPRVAAMGAFVEHHLGLHVLTFGGKWRESSRNPLLDAAVDAWAALRADRPPEPPTARRQPTTKAGKRLLADCAGLVEQPNETPRIVAKAAELLCQVLIPRIEDEARAALGASPPPPDLSGLRALFTPYFEAHADPTDDADNEWCLKHLPRIAEVRAALGRATPEEPTS